MVANVKCGLVSAVVDAAARLAVNQIQEEASEVFDSKSSFECFNRCRCRRNNRASGCFLQMLSMPRGILQSHLRAAHRSLAVHTNEGHLPVLLI